MIDNFYEVKKAYKNSNFGEIQKKIYGSKYILIGASLLGCVILLYSIASKNLIGFAIVPLFFAIIIFLGVKIENRYFETYFLLKDDFYINYQKNRVSQRALLFFEKLNSMSIDIDVEKLTERLNIETKHLKYNTWEMPYVVASFTVLGILFQSLLSFGDELLLAQLLVIAIVVCFLTISYFYSFRTEEAKMEELKLFLYWYNLFGKTIVKK
ncbi:MAG: hypothetical protein IBX45_00655 [Campylobacterales bacterium]|nr:hypothetical protein [Campylobacterales bacterium]